MISGWSQLMWARSHVMWVEGTRLVAVNVSRNRRCSQAELFMISSRYNYRVSRDHHSDFSAYGVCGETCFVFIQYSKTALTVCHNKTLQRSSS